MRLGHRGCIEVFELNDEIRLITLILDNAKKNKATNGQNKRLELTRRG